MVGMYSPTLSPWLAWTSYGLRGAGSIDHPLKRGSGEASNRDLQDHATFRENSVVTGLVGQAYGFPLFDPM